MNCSKIAICMHIIMLFALRIHSQDINWDWAHSFGGEQVDYSRSVCISNDNDIYVTGTFTSNILEIGLTSHNNNSNQNDSFIAKLDIEGNILWSKTFGGANIEFLDNITFDNVGNLYISGYFTSNVLLIDDEIITNSGNQDGLIICINNQGVVQWSASFGGTGNDQIKEVSIYEDQLYVCGSSDSPTFVIGEDQIQTDGQVIGFLSKLNLNGTPIWTQFLTGDNGFVSINSIETHESGVYFGGESNASNINSEVSNYPFNPNFVSSSIVNFFIGEFNTNGSNQWLTTFCGNGINRLNGFDITSNNELVLIGTTTSDELFSNTEVGALLNFSGTIEDSYILKVNQVGIPIWIKSLIGSMDDVLWDVDVDVSSGDIYTCGYFSSPEIQFNGTTITNPSNSSMTLLRLDTNGLFIWNKQITSSDSEPCLIEPTSLKVLSTDNIVVTGGYSCSDVVFDTTSVNNEGSYDCFVAKTTRSNSTSIYTEELGLNINTYPNPCSDKLTISLPKRLIGGSKLSIEIINMGGCQVYTDIFDFNSNPIIFEIPDLKSGVYTLRLTSDKLNYTEKIFIK